MEQPDILKNGVPKDAGTHNAWIGHAAAGGYDLRSESYRRARPVLCHVF